MSIKYLNHINLQGNRIEGATIEPLGAAPSNNLQIGRVYYDTSGSTKALRIYDGSNFVSITGDITGVANTTTGQLTITNPDGPIPSFAIVTGAIANAGTGLATADQIHTFVTTQTDSIAADTTGTAAKVTVTDSNANTAFPLVFHDESNALLDDTGVFEYNPNSGALTLPSANFDGVFFLGTVSADPVIRSTSNDQDIYIQTQTSGSIVNNLIISPTSISGTAIKDEDNMASNSASHLATQQSIKAYVDAQVDTHDTLAELTDTTITTPADGAMLLYDTGTSKWIDNVMSGDATLTDAGALTLATVNSNVGSYGSATAIPAITVNAKGLITAVTTNAISTTLTVDADSGTGDVALATDDLRIVGTANEIETSVGKASTDVTVTIGLPNDVSINSQLTVGTASGTDAPVIKSISNSTAENILLEGRETSSASAPDLVLYRNAGTPVDSDTLGVLEFRGRNAMGSANTADISYAGFYSRIYDASNQDSIMSLSLNKGNGSGAYKSAAIFKLLGSNNSGTGALLINPANDLSVPTHNLDVNGTGHFSGAVTIQGDLTVSGNQTTKNSEVVLIEDNIITLNSNETGTPSEDSGIEIERGTSTNAILYWDESTDRWSQRLAGGTEYKLHTEQNDVALGTHTSGNYVGNITEGTNISISNAAGEGTSREISVTGLDNYDYWNLKVNNTSVDNISTTESVDFVGGGGITIAFENGEDVNISHSDTSSQASVDNSGNAVIQDVTLDTYGHVTALVSKTIEVPTDRMFAGTIGDGSAVSYNIDNSGASSPHINHGLGTDSSQFMVQLIEVSSGDTVHADVSRKTGGRVQVVFATGNAPATNGIKVLINKIG